MASRGHGHYEIVRLLVDAGADLDNEKGSPLESSRRCHHDDIVEMLQRTRARPRARAGATRYPKQKNTLLNYFTVIKKT